MRIYDPRVGRFLSIDPLTKKYPWYTPFQFASNRPIVATDIDGLEANPPGGSGGTPPTEADPDERNGESEPGRDRMWEEINRRRAENRENQETEDDEEEIRRWGFKVSKSIQALRGAISQYSRGAFDRASVVLNPDGSITVKHFDRETGKEINTDDAWVVHQ